MASINLWVTKDNDIPSKGAEALYENSFRGSDSGTVCNDLHQEWLPTFSKITDQIEYLTGFLNRSHSSCSSPSDIHSVRTVADDYQIIFNLLGLSLRSLAVFFKFRQVFKCEWHDKVATINLNNLAIKNLLINELGKITMEIKEVENNESLLNESDSLRAEIMAINDSESRNISVLELVEMMELIIFKMGSVKPGNYSSNWDVFGHKDIKVAVKQWFDYIASFRSREKFFEYLLTASPDIRDLHFKHILREYESFQSGKNLHFEPMDIEHTFPIDRKGLSSLESYKFSDQTDYEKFYEILGNKIWLDSGLNRAIQNNPLSTKAKAYETQSFAHTTVPPDRHAQSSINLGKKFLTVKDNSHYKYYLLLRRLEIILFALKRF